MRIIAGRLGGRTFQSPSGHRTHPMSDKIRGAIFNMLGDINGLTVLDAFAGSGALSFEAISRGAKEAVALDVDTDAYKAIQGNIQSLGLQPSIKAIRTNSRGWSKRNQDHRFDLIMCDPPYDNTQPEIIERLANHVKIDGLLILSLPPHADVRLKDNFSRISAKSYGDATLSVYRRVQI
jgi:16S rRNA (guanine966-N2)-methyltransferase